MLPAPPSAGAELTSVSARPSKETCVRAIAATKISPDNPSAGAELIDVPEPTAGPGEVVVTVKAASLNHHDLWTLRGVGVSDDVLPMVLGSDVAGVTED